MPSQLKKSVQINTARIDILLSTTIAMPLAWFTPFVILSYLHSEFQFKQSDHFLTTVKSDNLTLLQVSTKSHKIQFEQLIIVYLSFWFVFKKTFSYLNSNFAQNGVEIIVLLWWNFVLYLVLIYVIEIREV